MMGSEKPFETEYETIFKFLHELKNTVYFRDHTLTIASYLVQPKFYQSDSVVLAKTKTNKVISKFHVT